MKPTIEEVKKIANWCGAETPNGIYPKAVLFYPRELQAFAQHYYEAGRKDQRESDANLFECDPSCENLSFIAPAILNNTGE